jgi:hypothetical protein
MKPLTNAIEALASNVSRHAAVYATARPNHPALAPYATIADVLAALVDRSRLTADERDPILIAIVIEHQRTRHALWQSILLKAFAPMLLYLRKGQGRADDADLDQAVLLSFLEAARSIRTESHVARCLRIVTEAKVYEDSRKARRHEGGDVFDDEVQYPSPYGASTHTKVAASEVLAILEAEGGAELRDLMFSTCALEETVADYVARVHTRETPAARVAIADRLRRVRLNALQQLSARVQRKEQTRGLASVA